LFVSQSNAMVGDIDVEEWRMDLSQRCQIFCQAPRNLAEGVSYVKLKILIHIAYYVLRDS
jgi:hypothetical protein